MTSPPRIDSAATPSTPATEMAGGFLDTNILLYSISTSAAESAKRQRARELLDDSNCALSVQVLQEFYVQATRVSRADALSHDLAVSLIRTWRRFPVQETTLAVLDAALDVVARHRFSYWDACIIAAALALDCDRLYSEDMSHGQRVGTLTIFNPFG
jgi:predicted nucleic acid-binding protein